MKAIHKIQGSLSAQTKDNPGQPLPALMHLLADRAVLYEAWRQVLQNGKHTIGPDRLSAKMVLSEDGGVDKLLNQIASRLHQGDYTPGPVKRFEIPKPSNPDKMRPLVILNLADRIVHTAVKLLLEPVLEVRQTGHSYGFRPGRCRFDELVTVARMVQNQPERYQAALTADIASCFDQIDHQQVREELELLVSDKPFLTLCNAVLAQVGSGVEGWFKTRPVGLLQGSPLSLLLANLALARFDRTWKRDYGREQMLLRYADDLVVLAPT